MAIHLWPEAGVICVDFAVSVVTPYRSPLTEVSTNGCADAAEAGAALQAALDAAVAAGTPQVVLVGDGVYEMKNAVKVTTPVVVRAKAGETPRITYTASPFAFSAAGSALIGLTMEKEAG